MFCQFCGSQISDGAQFCPTCGRSQTEAAGAASPAYVPPTGVKAQTGSWISQGWQLVKSDITIFAVMALLLMIIGAAVPIILTGALTAGFQLVCMRKLYGRRADFGDLFKGFNFLVPTLVASLLISVLTAVGGLLCIIPGLVIAAMYSFTYLFIVDKKMDFWPAMEASHAIVKQDYVGFTLFLTALIGIQILGVLACFVGLLVTIPIHLAAVTIAYKELVGFEQSTIEMP